MKTTQEPHKMKTMTTAEKFERMMENRRETAQQIFGLSLEVIQGMSLKELAAISEGVDASQFPQVGGSAKGLARTLIVWKNPQPDFWRVKPVSSMEKIFLSFKKEF
jgi:hypothetical protein